MSDDKCGGCEHAIHAKRCFSVKDNIQCQCDWERGVAPKRKNQRR